MSYRLGVDVGGTFTDVLLVDESTGETWRSKTPSTPHDQSIAVLRGIEKAAAAAGADLSEISAILHGTTVATNAILEAKGAKVGLVTTRGFRQVLQIRRSFVPGGLAGWITWPKPTPLASLEDTVEANERIGTTGDVVEALDEDDIRAKLKSLAGHHIDALAISLINSFANSSHEVMILRIAEEELPGIPISLSSRVLPEMREYERTLTTVANGYVQPQVARYLGNLQARLQEGGLSSELAILRSDGGLASPATAIEKPVTLLLSGPAGGVTGAAWAARHAGFGDFLTFDMGGTSTDVSLVRGLKPKLTRETNVGDLNVRVSSVDVRTVGAGGGSLAHVPELTRALRVGPESAGAVPGPAAYGKGGIEPTVTDANVVLGYLPAELAGGEIVLDRDASLAAVADLVASTGLGGPEAVAAGIIDIVNENMLGALRLVSVQQGFDPREFALVAFGGAGPLHANALGILLGSWPVIIPPSPGVLNAYGDVMTSIRDEAARTFVRGLADSSDLEFSTVFAELEESVRASLEAQGVARETQNLGYELDIRYHGQGFELTVEVDAAEFGAARRGIDALAEAFDDEHRRKFSFVLDGTDREVVNVRVTGTGPATEIMQPKLAASMAAPIASRTVEIWVGGGPRDAGVYERVDLRAGDIVRGPAIVVEMDSTALVLPGHEALVHPSGSLLITPTLDSAKD
ncbi:MAG: hydantoinase/oxoprolinase family protein [Actinomycetota bacterium]|nr:hydantoinase/oxoprolinase family protein [Actinomycetota bacterium]